MIWLLPDSSTPLFLPLGAPTSGFLHLLFPLPRPLCYPRLSSTVCSLQKYSPFSQIKIIPAASHSPSIVFITIYNNLVLFFFVFLITHTHIPTIRLYQTRDYVCFVHCFICRACNNDRLWCSMDRNDSSHT